MLYSTCKGTKNIVLTYLLTENDGVGSYVLSKKFADQVKDVLHRLLVRHGDVERGLACLLVGMNQRVNQLLCFLLILTRSPALWGRFGIGCMFHLQFCYVVCKILLQAMLCLAGKRGVGFRIRFGINGRRADRFCYLVHRYAIRTAAVLFVRVVFSRLSTPYPAPANTNFRLP